MDLKKEWKQILISILGCVVIVWIGIIILSNIRIQGQHDFPIIGNYCINKEGEQNIEHLDLIVIKDKHWNCSTCINGTCFIKITGVTANAL